MVEKVYFRLGVKKIGFNPLILIALLSFTLYANTLSNDFVWDDEKFIENREELSDFSTIIKYFYSDFYGYSPLREAFFVLSFKVFSTNPVGYRVIAITTHALVSVMVYLLAIEITKKKRVSLMASILFAVHPIHTENIAFTTSSIDQIGILFYLLALYLYARDSEKYRWHSIFFSGMAIFWGEFPITLPIMIVLYDFAFRKIELKRYIPYFLLAFLYLFIRFVLLGLGGRVEQHLGGSFYINQLTMGTVYLKYISLLFIPVNLTVTQEIDIASSIFELQFFFAWIFLLVLLLLAPRIYKRSRMAFFCLGWFFVALLPVSNLVPIQNFLAERYLYLPSIGFFVLLSLALNYLFELPPKKIRVFSIVIFILMTLSYSVLTIDRNSDWSDSISLWSSTIETSPSVAMPYNNLGDAYLDDGRIDEAIPYFKKAIEVAPDYARAHVNLGTAYLYKGEIDLARDQFNEAVRIDPDLSPAHAHLAVIYRDAGQWEEAVEEFRASVDYIEDPVERQLVLGDILYRNGFIEEAFEEYVYIIDLRTTDGKLREELLGRSIQIAGGYMKEGRQEQAVSIMKRSIEIFPASVTLHEYLGQIYYFQGRFDLAIEEFGLAYQLSPEDESIKMWLADSYNELGISLAEEGHYRDAITEFNRGIEINSDFVTARCNAGLAYFYLNDYTNAIEEFEGALAIEPDNLICKGYYENAIQFINKTSG